MKHTVISLAIAAACVTGVGTSAFAQSKELVLYNWSNYISPELIKRFTAETGITVTIDTYDTNETMLSKLQAGGAGYDIVVPSNSTVQSMIRSGLVIEFDAKSLPNFKNVKAEFAAPEFDPERKYSIPYVWGITAIAYDTAKVDGGKIENSWKEIFEPRPELVGKIAMLKDAKEVLGAASYYLGVPYCVTDPKQGQAILDLLEKQKPAVKVYSSEGTIDRLATGETSLQQMWNGSFHRAHKKLPTAAYMFPKEGLSLWGDNFVIPKGAKNIDNAKAFLNFMLDPKNAAESSNFTGYNNGVKGSEEYLDPSLKDDPAVNVSEEHVKLFRPTPECPKESLDLKDKIWTRLLR